VVCGDCHDFKIVTSLPTSSWGQWEGKKFAPEADFLAKIKSIPGVTDVETQTYTIEPLGTITDVSGLKQETGRRAARFVADAVCRIVQEKGAARIIVATGASQFEFLEALVQIPWVPWDKVTAFHLDEYVGMQETHTASFRGYLQVPSVPLVSCSALGGSLSESAGEALRAGQPQVSSGSLPWRPHRSGPSRGCG